MVIKVGIKRGFFVDVDISAQHFIQLFIFYFPMRTIYGIIIKRIKRRRE